MNKRPVVLFIAKRASSASTRYRCINYFPFLIKKNWLPRYAEAKKGIVNKIDMLKKVSDADVVVIARKTFAFPFRHLLAALSKKIVFDFDDAIFLKSSGEKSLVRQQRFKSILNITEQVWAGNRYLAQNASKYCSSVKVIPTAVDCEKYNIKTPKQDRFIDIVWIGSSSTKKYLEQIIPVLDDVAKIFPQVRLKIIADFDLETQIIETCPVAWSEEQEAKEIKSSHIGIAMMPDDPWSKGKCGLKVIQYMAASLPVVVTDTGVHSEIIENNKSGFLVNNKSEWINALSVLIEDKNLRETMGLKGFEIANEKYSLKITSQNMAKSLNRLIKT